MTDRCDHLHSLASAAVALAAPIPIGAESASSASLVATHTPCTLERTCQAQITQAGSDVLEKLQIRGNIGNLIDVGGAIARALDEYHALGSNEIAAHALDAHSPSFLKTTNVDKASTAANTPASSSSVGQGLTDEITVDAGTRPPTRKESTVRRVQFSSTEEFLKAWSAQRTRSGESRRSTQKLYWKQQGLTPEGIPLPPPPTRNNPPLPPHAYNLLTKEGKESWKVDHDITDPWNDKAFMSEYNRQTREMRKAKASRESVAVEGQERKATSDVTAHGMKRKKESLAQGSTSTDGAISGSKAAFSSMPSHAAKSLQTSGPSSGALTRSTLPQPTSVPSYLSYAIDEASDPEEWLSWLKSPGRE